MYNLFTLFQGKHDFSVNSVAVACVTWLLFTWSAGQVLHPHTDISMPCECHETHVTGCDWLRKHVDLVRVLIEVTFKYLETTAEQNFGLWGNYWPHAARWTFFAALVYTVHTFAQNKNAKIKHRNMQQYTISLIKLTKFDYWKQKYIAMYYASY